MAETSEGIWCCRYTREGKKSEWNRYLERYRALGAGDVKINEIKKALVAGTVSCAGLGLFNRELHLQVRRVNW